MQFNLKLTEKGAIYVTSQQPVDIHGKPYNRSLLVGVLLIGTFCDFKPNAFNDGLTYINERI